MCIKCTQDLSRSLREKLFMEACKQEGELERTKRKKKRMERNESMDRKGNLGKRVMFSIRFFHFSALKTVS